MVEGNESEVSAGGGARVEKVLPVGASGELLRRLPTVRRRQRRVEVCEQPHAPIRVYTEHGNLTQAAKQWIFRAIGYSRHETADGKPDFDVASRWLKENGLDIPASVIKRVYRSLPERESYEVFDRKTCQEERIRTISAMAMRYMGMINSIAEKVGNVLQDETVLTQKALETRDLQALVKSFTSLLAAFKETSEVIQPRAGNINVFSEKTAIALPFNQTVLPPPEEPEPQPPEEPNNEQ